MKYQLLLVLMLPGVVSAADVRVLNIGDSCADIEAKETALGSQLIPSSRIPVESSHAFRVRDFDSDVELMYLCHDGKLFTGNYVWRFELLEDAAKGFRSVHDRLLMKYGTPFLDSTPWHVRRLDQPATISSAPGQYMTEWRTKRVVAHLLIGQDRQVTDAAGWHVALIIAPLLSPAASKSGNTVQ